MDVKPHKKFSFERKHWIIFSCLIGLILFALAYLFMYIPANERYINERRFADMQTIEKNIDYREENTFQLIQRLLKAFENPETNRVTLENYIRKSFKEGKRTLFTENIKHLSGIDSLPTTLQTSDELQMYVRPGRNKLEFWGISANAPAGRWLLNMAYTYEDYFSSITKRAGFDEFVVVMNDTVRFETFSTGLNGSKFDSLIQVEKNLRGANIRKIAITGSDYQAFLLPFSFENSHKGLLMGLVKYKSYQQERVQLPASKVLVVVIGAILLLILLPWIKLFNLGKGDRLTLLDGAFCFIVAMLLMSIIFLAFADLAIRYQHPSQQEGLKNLANNITQRTSKQLDAMKGRLISLDSLFAQNENLQQNINLSGSTGIRPGTNYSQNEQDQSTEIDSEAGLAIENLFKPVTMEQVFWLDNKSGEEFKNWSRDSINGPHGIFNQRKYFLGQQLTSDSIFMLDQVVSWTSGEFRTVLSRKSSYVGKGTNSSKKLIACLGFTLSALDKPTLPEGYEFAMVNDEGEVLYHSNPIHNLNENFAKETTDSYKVKNHLKAHAEKEFITRYKGKEMLMYLKPVNLSGFRYNIIVLLDNRFQTARQTGAFSFTLTMLLAFFVIVFGQMILVVWASARKSNLIFNRIQTDWIWPRPSHHYVYRFASIYHAIVFGLLYVTYYFSSFFSFLFALLSAIGIITVIVNYLYIEVYRMEERPKLVQYKHRNLLTLYIFLALINLVSIVNLWDDPGGLFLLWGFESCCGIAGGLLVKRFNKFLASDRYKLSISTNKTYFLTSYSVMSVSRLIITSGLPVLFFYQYAYNYQLAIETHYRHLKMAEKIQTTTLTDTNSTDIFERHGLYPDNFFINHVQSGKQPNGVQWSGTLAENKTTKLLNRFHFYENTASHLLDGIVENQSADDYYSVSPTMGAYFGKEPYITRVGFAPSGQLYFSSNPISFNYPMVLRDAKGKRDNLSIILFWLFLVMIILIFVIIIRKIISKLFALEVPGERMSGKLAASIIQFKHGSRLTYIAGLPGSKKMAFIMEAIPEKDRLIIDLYDELNKRNYYSKTSTVILNHFEYILYDRKYMLDTLALLEHLLVTPSRPAIVILSTVHLDYALNLINRLLTLDGKGDATWIKERFQAILGHFNTIIMPISYMEKDKMDLAKDEENTEKIWMQREFGISPFTERLRLPHKDIFTSGATPPIPAGQNLPLWKKIPDDLFELFNDQASYSREEAVWSLQNVINIFYHHIWQSLGPEERYLVYDLAEEGLVNGANKYHLSMLIQKGLIRRKEPDGQLELMNESFKSFVLISVQKAEALQLKNELKSTGTWSEMRTPILLVLVGLMAILLASQEEAFSSILGYLTAIAALIPTMNAIFSFIKPAQAKP